MISLVDKPSLKRLRPAALVLVALVALSAWSCDDVRYRPFAQEAPATESDAAGQPAGAAEKKAPDLGEEFKRRVFERYGYLGLIVFAAVAVVFGIWWKWPDIRKRPFVGKIVDRFRRAPLPTADPARFTVAIAHLQDDDEQEHEKLIFQDLNEGFAGEDKNAVQILRFDRTIETAAAQDLESDVATGHQTARSYLAESGAEVLIWGTAIRSGEASVPKLYWTTAREGDPSRNPGRYATEDLALPEVFWTDLVDVLRLLVVARDAEFHSLQGHFVVDRVGPFVEKVRSLLTGGGHGWTEEASARVQLVLANSLLTFGAQGGNNHALIEAINRYREVLGHYTRERVPLYWAGTQNNLGNALQRLGGRERGTAPLEEAVAAYREALKEWTRQAVPLDWALTQNNLGSALERLGRREEGTGRLEEAVGAYREALREWTRERVPLYWAGTQNNLGNALQELGDREKRTARLEEAVAAYRAALEERPREKVPLHWAGTQSNLGNALRRLGERESGTARLEEAVASFRAALQEWTREKVPLDWAMAQNNLGGALRSLGERRGDAKLVCDALGAHLAGWEVFTQAKAGHYAAIAKRGVEADLAVLKNVAEAAEYERCLEQHRAGLDTVSGRDN